ncbi:MAG: DUF423 domain-containing protein [Polyangiales bacterium]
MLSAISVRVILIAAALHGFAAVGLGAFGAHALRARFEDGAEGLKAQGWWHTATQYQLTHAVALFALAALSARAASGVASAAALCFAVGSLVFSGTLYAMALGAPRWFGAITPIGGLLLLGGWACVLGLAFKH